LTRIVFAVLGLAALVWGAILVVQFAVQSWPDTRSAAAFLIAGPVVHDAVVAPVVGVVGLVIARRLGPAWRTPVRIGAALSAVLALLAVPALWRAYAGPPNPGLEDRNYGLGLVISLAIVWVIVLACGFVSRRSAHGKRAPRRS
jgi:hypothetical protein